MSLQQYFAHSQWEEIACQENKNSSVFFLNHKNTLFMMPPRWRRRKSEGGNLVSSWHTYVCTTYMWIMRMMAIMTKATSVECLLVASMAGVDGVIATSSANYNINHAHHPHAAPSHLWHTIWHSECCHISVSFFPSLSSIFTNINCHALGVILQIRTRRRYCYLYT